MAVLRFIRGNLGYLLWFAFYFLISWSILGGNWQAFGWASLIYGVSITIALSPVGEVLLRAIYGLRTASTREEKEYLLPVFEEVYEMAKEKFPKLSKNVKLYIEDTMIVNALAMGRNTIAVTRGAVKTLSQDELKGVIAHEFGHLVNGDTKALLLNVIGNGFFALTIIAVRIIILIFRWIVAQFDGSGIVSLVLWFMNVMLELYIFAIMIAGQILLSATSREAEYYADYFAYEIGLGDELISAFYILQQISIPRNVTIMERLRASHPNMGKRIERLEQLQEVG